MVYRQQDKTRLSISTLDIDQFKLHVEILPRWNLKQSFSYNKRPVSN